MRFILLPIIFIFLVFGITFSQGEIKRDPDTRKDWVNVFYKPQYTLFDLWSDEPISVSSDGNYHIYYATNENKVPKELVATPQQLSSYGVYKFKNYENCKNWCDGKIYTNEKTANNISQNEILLKRQLEITSSEAFKEKFVNALLNIKAHKTIEALTILDQLISEAPDVLSLLYFYRGKCKIDLKKYNAAIADFNVFIKNHSSGVDKCDLAEAYFLRGAAYRILEKIEKACEDGKIAKSFGCTDFIVDDLTLFQMCNSNNEATSFNQNESPVSNNNSSQNCYSCSGTGKCRQCNKVFKNHYWGGKYKGWKSDSETRLGYVICSECKGSGVKYGLMDDNNEPTSKPCYVSSCRNGWIYCTECNYNGNGSNLGSCKKCKGSGTSK